jgi:type IV pilus assembly protein PilO
MRVFAAAHFRPRHTGTTGWRKLMALEFKDFKKLKWFYQVLIVAAICGALLFGVWYMYLTPIESEIETKKKTLADLQATIVKSLQQQKMLEQLKKEAVELQAKLDMLKTVLPQAKETDEVLRSVQQSASTSALRILRVDPRPTIDHEVYIEWPINMEVIGTYHNIGAFLDKIRNLPRIVNISGLRIQGRASEGDAAFTSSVGATYTATTFVYREEQIATAAPPPTPVK